MTNDFDMSSDAIADRVNCYAMRPWLEALADRGGVPLVVPLGAGRARVDIPIVTLGIVVTLFRHVDDTLPEGDQVVLNRVSFDPARAVLPFGLDGPSLTPEGAKRALSDDVAGGRSADLQRGNTRISYFLPDDARVVELTFAATLVGISSCTVFRLGGEFPRSDIDRLFGPARLGVSPAI